jgi:hypothetical protein
MHLLATPLTVFHTTCCCCRPLWHLPQATSTSTTSSNGIAADKAVDPLLREAVLREAVMYGEMVQAVYDTLQTKDEFSADNGLCAPPAMQEGQRLGAEAVGKYTTLGEDAKQYTVSTVPIEPPTRCVQFSCCVRGLMFGDSATAGSALCLSV